MKQNVCLLIALFLFSFSARSSHIGGGQLRYEYNGMGYTFYLEFYTSCGGPAVGTTQTLYMKSPSLGVNSTVSMALISSGEVNMPCASSPTRCTSPTGTLPGYRRNVFTATVVLPGAAADWTFSAIDGIRSISNNLRSSNAIYIEAYLNNLNGENSSAVVPTVQPAFIGLNSNNYVPIQAVDIDGDSLMIFPIAPFDGPGRPVAYMTGHTATTPMGGGLFAINQASGVVSYKAVMIGTYNVAYQVQEYRNGVLVGTHVRDYSIMSIPGSGTFSYSYPFPTVPIVPVTTCPGKPGSASITLIDSASTDSVFVNVDTLDLMPGWNFNVTNSNGMGGASATITWNVPSGVNPATMPYFFIKVKTWDASCPRGSTEYWLPVKVEACPTDSVWPGDANSDNVANLWDVLSIAVAYNQTGAVRPGATTTWQPEWALDWANNYPLTTTNMKHGDCNGDGIINVSDLGAIFTNFGLTHPKGSPRNKTTGAPDLYADVDGIVAMPGMEVSVPVYLGTTANALDGVYGIAAAVTLNNITLAEPASMSAENSVLATAANGLNFMKNMDNNTIMWAHARTNHTNGVANGRIGTLTFRIPAGTPAGTSIGIDMNDVNIIDKDGNPIAAPFNVLPAQLKVQAVDIASANGVLQSAVVVPNPSQGDAQLRVSLMKGSDVQLSVTDVTGRVVHTAAQSMQAGTNNVWLPVTLASGMYTIQLHTADGATQAIKWMVK